MQIFQHGLSLRADKGERYRPQKSADADHGDSGSIHQLRHHINGFRDNRNALDLAGLELARDLRGGGAGIENNHLAGLNQVGGRAADLGFLPAMQGCLKTQRVVAGGFQLPDGAAMRAH